MRYFTCGQNFILCRTTTNFQVICTMRLYLHECTKNETKSVTTSAQKLRFTFNKTI